MPHKHSGPLTPHADDVWEKVLWKRQPFPDNYTPDSFLQHLVGHSRRCSQLPVFASNPCSEETPSEACLLLPTAYLPTAAPHPQHTIRSLTNGSQLHVHYDRPSMTPVTHAYYPTCNSRVQPRVTFMCIGTGTFCRHREP